MKKALSVVFAVVMTLSLAGCGGSTTPVSDSSGGENAAAPAEGSSGGDTASGDKIVIRAIGAGFGNEQDSTDPASKVTIQGYHAIETMYEELRTDVDLQLSGVPWDNWQAKLQSAAAANDVDILVHGASMTDLVDDLTERINAEPAEVMDKMLLKGVIRRPITDDYTRQVITGLPITIANSCIQYDKTIFDNYGVEYPNDTWTWDDVLEAAKKMTGTDPVTGEQTYGYFFDGNNTDALSRTHTSYLFAKDYTAFEFKDNQMDTVIHYDSPEIISSLEWYNEIVQTMPISFVEGRGKENFGTESNNVAMLFEQDALVNYNKIVPLGLEERYGFSNPPALEGGREGWADFTGDWNMAIAKNANNKDECWEYMKWMATDADVAAWNYQRGNVPNSVEGMQKLIDDGVPFAQIFYDSMMAYPEDLFLGTCKYYDGFLGSAKAIISTAFSGMFAGELTPEEAAAEIQKGFEDQASAEQ